MFGCCVVAEAADMRTGFLSDLAFRKQAMDSSASQEA